MYRLWPCFMGSARLKLVKCIHAASEVATMSPMVWHPEERDQQVNRYLDKINHAPYIAIMAFLLGLFCAMTVLVLMGNF